MHGQAAEEFNNEIPGNCDNIRDIPSLLTFNIK